MYIKSIHLPLKREKYLKARWLTKQYNKQKVLIFQWHFLEVDFKLRQPKKDGIYAFRINKQFRALAHRKNNSELYIFRIDNHDNKRRK